MDKEKIKKAVTMFLEAVGEDPDREDLKATPRRVAEMCEEIFSGINRDVASDLEVFLAEKHDEIVLLKNIPLYSVCEHHLLPFIGKAHIAYIPKDNRITGLSKLVRVIKTFSRRLQVQERLTTQVADLIMSKLKPMGVLVVVEAEHLCMSMRGVCSPGTVTVTSAVRGIFQDNQKTRAEALALLHSGK